MCLDMCIVCRVRRWSQKFVDMLPWLTIPLVVLWVLSQAFPPAWRLEVTSPRVACVVVLMLSLGWYEVIMPRLQELRSRRTHQLREQRKVELTVEARWRKEAIRHCRNCRAPYKEQSPPGGRFMCNTCGHVSKRPILGISGQVGVDLGPVSEKSLWWSEVFELLSCLEMRVASFRGSWVVNYVLYLLQLPLRPISYVWDRMKLWRSHHEDMEECDRVRETMRKEETDTQGRSEKVRKKAEEKRLARLKREQQEESERQEREEMARLVEEQRRKTEQLKAQQAQAEEELAAQRELDARSKKDIERRRKEREAREREREKLLRASELEASREKQKRAEKRTVEKIVKGMSTSVKTETMHGNRVTDVRPKMGGSSAGLRPGPQLFKPVGVPTAPSSPHAQVKSTHILKTKVGAVYPQSPKTSPNITASRPAVAVRAPCRNPGTESATWSKVLLCGLKATRGGGPTSQSHPAASTQSATSTIPPSSKQHTGLDWRPLLGSNSSAATPASQQMPQHTAATPERPWHCLFSQPSLFTPPTANPLPMAAPLAASLCLPQDLFPYGDTPNCNTKGLPSPSSPAPSSPVPVGYSSSCTSNSSSKPSSPGPPRRSTSGPTPLSPNVMPLPVPLEALSQGPPFTSATSVDPWGTVWMPQVQQQPNPQPLHQPHLDPPMVTKDLSDDDVPMATVKEVLCEESWSSMYDAQMEVKEMLSPTTVTYDNSLWSAPLNVPPLVPPSGGDAYNTSKPAVHKPWQKSGYNMSPKGVVGDRKPVDNVSPPWGQSRSVLDKALQLQLWGEEAMHLEQPPPEFLDCITQELMTDPVITADGHSYERSAIERWLRQHDTSPKTGQVLPGPPGQDGKAVDKTLRPNHILRSQIIEYQERRQRVMRSMANNVAEWGVLGSSLWSGVELCNFSNQNMHPTWFQNARGNDLSAI